MKNFNNYLKSIGEYGIVTQVNYPLITVEGLPNVKSRELVHFESGALGQVFSIHPNIVEIILLTNEKVHIEEQVVRTNSFLSVPVCDSLLGRIITPLGETVIPKNHSVHTPEVSKQEGARKHKTESLIETKTRGIEHRAGIKRPFDTGVMLVDLLLPLGMGQKELIIGDRKTGKTSFLLTAIKNQVQKGSVVIYAAIGQKQSSIKNLIGFLQKEKILDRVVVIVTTPFDSPGLIYIAPFSAITIAEYFRDTGRNSLVVLDDLSAHAKYYREVSLIAKRFPGRESYPGDIFHTHARLMERAGNFKGEVSITCLPVVETIESDMASYIATNIMSMTDGHIFFDQDTFAKGRRPAINIPLSVTRVGRQTQSPLKRDINQKLTKLLTTYEEMINLAHFGAELSGKVQKTLSISKNIYTLLDQPDHAVVPEEVQLILIALVMSDMVEKKQIPELKKTMLKAVQDKKNKELLTSIIAVDTLYDLQLAAAKKKNELFEMAHITQSAPVPPVSVSTAQPFAAPATKEEGSGEALQRPSKSDLIDTEIDVLIQDSTTKKAREKLAEMEARLSQ